MTIKLKLKIENIENKKCVCVGGVGVGGGGGRRRKKNTASSSYFPRFESIVNRTQQFEVFKVDTTVLYYKRKQELLLVLDEIPMSGKM